MARFPAVRLAAAFALPATCVAQEPIAPAAQTFTEAVSVAWVHVPVVVVGPAGPIDDLRREDFRLFVDGRELPIGSFESGPDLPVSLFYLQDLSGSMALAGKLEASRTVLDCLLDRALPGDRFALFTFAGGRFDPAVPSTAKIERLRAAADAWKPYGTTALHDAVAGLPRLLVDGPTTRRAVVLVSDGMDNASSIAANEARDRIRGSEIPVYVVGLETGSPFELTTDGAKRYRYADVMNLLAHLTGGRYHSTFDDEELDAACDGILDDLRHQYILGFATRGAGEARPRSIEVRVRHKKARLSHRREYEGHAPAADGS